MGFLEGSLDKAREYKTKLDGLKNQAPVYGALLLTTFSLLSGACRLVIAESVDKSHRSNCIFPNLCTETLSPTLVKVYWEAPAHMSDNVYYIEQLYAKYPDIYGVSPSDKNYKSLNNFRNPSRGFPATKDTSFIVRLAPEVFKQDWQAKSRFTDKDDRSVRNLQVLVKEDDSGFDARIFRVQAYDKAYFFQGATMIGVTFPK